MSSKVIVAPKLTVPQDICYYDPIKNWRKIKPHLDNPDVQAQLQNDFHKYTWGLWRRKFNKGDFPADFENCDWQLDHQGRRPAYWKYVKHAACHWLVNFLLKLAQLVEPDRLWKIVTHDDHSMVWDGDQTLFDFNFCALGIPAKEAFRLASQGRELKVGELRKVYCPEHYTKR